MALAKEEMIGHAGDVVADHAVARLSRREFGVVRRHALRVFEEKRKKRVERRDGTVAVFDDGRLRIEAREKEALQVAVQLGYGR